MGQKVNPIGFRLGYIKGWDSSWIASKKDFADKLMEDDAIRKYIYMRMPSAAISKIVVERTLKTITLSIHTARPGIIIGKGGAEVDNMREELKRIRGKDIQINIIEVRVPELNAKLLGQSIANQLRGRASYRRTMKKAIESAMRAGAKGVKIRLSGRLGGAEMARVEEYREGRVPLHTLRADIDYAVIGANTIYGTIGVKVWIFKKEIYGRPSLSPSEPSKDKYNAGKNNNFGSNKKSNKKKDNRSQKKNKS
ncbi:MAG: 30S ribosomal protein S3 [Bacteroidetes bacterium]|nr:30S ribosomal protein S3 [Bacteroidota bacterium]